MISGQLILDKACQYRTCSGRVAGTLSVSIPHLIKPVNTSVLRFNNKFATGKEQLVDYDGHYDRFELSSPTMKFLGVCRCL
ncbi:hypothetical protein I3760_08G013600 [Carya illinoinensis]|uniref:Uncharacterized protein n=1 Tax=Carya illinoinensis TaxID=32201 RepID=A0A8T1PH76_CARIL|nr:hypothetical protein I3760_08G013600 [Carya illinoinensis]KAG6643826.1 hypothetical protein CIPAW_08G013500 [Carya illinoinensis]